MVLDKQRALKELGIPEELYIELLSDLLTQVDGAIVGLEGAILANDFNTIIQIAHSIKGSAGNMRADEIYGTAKDIEQAAREGKDMKIIKEGVDKLRAQFAELKKAMNRG